MLILQLTTRLTWGQSESPLKTVKNILTSGLPWWSSGEDFSSSAAAVGSVPGQGIKNAALRGWDKRL